MLRFLLLNICTICIGLVNGQAFRPNAEEMLDRYRHSAKMDSITKGKILNDKIDVHWQEDGTAFLYKRQLKDGGWQFRRMESQSGKNSVAFDHEKLALALSQYYGQQYDAAHLDLSEFWYAGVGKNVRIRFTLSDHKEQFFYGGNKGLEVADIKSSIPRGLNRFRTISDTLSPNKQWAVFTQNGNVFVRDLKSHSIVQYTHDGFGSLLYGVFSWSPDSRFLVCSHIDPVVDSSVYYVLSSVPNTTRGVLKSHPYKQPGDPFTSYELHVFDMQKQDGCKVKTDIIDFGYPPAIHWNKNGTSFLYERADRGHQRFRVISVDAITGDTSNVLDERTKTFIYQNRLFSFYLPETNEIIRSSEKDGWQHLYLVNQLTKLETEITKGEWVVRNVDSVDSKKREIWFSASGMNKLEDPYNVHYYRIGFDGNGLVDLTPEIGNHSVQYAPGCKYIVDSYSQVNIAPVTVLRQSSNGKIISSVEKADISALLATGVSLPEPFVAKGRDGKTDIYGIFLKPSDFDPNKKYPVIENIYAGPHDSFVPKYFLGYSEMQSIAELGFIVVYIDGMGTANRSKAFHDVCWKNIADAGFPDRILWIKALGEKYSFVDTSRVGIYGTSAGGQNTLTALLTHPEFYKVGVAACGCHDNRIDKQWWNEQWMGYPVGPWYGEQSNVTNACKLKGALMLIVGDADTNVPPESTYRVADALIKAGKAFDFLPVPGEDHTDGGPYGRMRTKDFFVRHLLGAEIPSRNDHPEFTLPKTGRRPSKVI